MAGLGEGLGDLGPVEVLSVTFENIMLPKTGWFNKVLPPGLLLATGGRLSGMLLLLLSGLLLLVLKLLAASGEVMFVALEPSLLLP